MNALRWILFGLVAFGLGAGAAYALNPPPPAIPAAAAEGIANDLNKVELYASQGHCPALTGRIASAQKEIRNLPSRIPASTQAQLQRAVQDVSRTALAQCENVAAEQRAADEAAKQKELEQQLQNTTPAEVVPTTPVVPDGGPDPGTGEGTTPTDPGTTSPDTTGGISIPDSEEIQGEIQRQQQKLKDNLKDSIDQVLNP